MLKRTAALAGVALLAASYLALANPGASAKIEVKPGETYYVCACQGCDCKTISSKEGKCSCGKVLVKATVARVDGDTAYFKADGWEGERAYSTVGKYACPCGAACGCKTVSQKPGTCHCGKELVKVGN
jgi:hypothetical protein